MGTLPGALLTSSCVVTRFQGGNSDGESKEVVFEGNH